MKSVGILLDNFKIKRWQKKIIDFINKHPNLNLEIYIVNNNEPSVSNSGLIYRAFQAVDRRIFKVVNDAFQVENLDNNSTIPVIYINGIETRFSYKFSEEDIMKIKNLDLDILIRFGFGILKGDILLAARYGVWSLHHGDNRVNRGGPPGFWEVVNGEEVTGATLQVLSSDLDGGKVLSKAFTKTNFTSFNRNKNEVFWSGVELFTTGLHHLAQDKLNSETFAEADIKQFYSRPLYKDPSNSAALKIHISFWLRRVKEAVRELNNSPQWFLLYRYRKDNKTETSVFRYKKLFPPKGYDWADPFVVEKDNKYYVFFEELYIKGCKGHISYFAFGSSGELLKNSPTKLLEEEYHLSYPFIFKEKDKYYMIPESANSGELWLYECLEFPDKWMKKVRIFKEKPFYDATLVHLNEMWYLFGTEKVINESSRDQYLCIYYSEDIFSGNWKAHPKNPIYRDIRSSRPAGRIFEQDGKLIRPSQIGAPKYGFGIQFNEISLLSPNDFIEKKIDKILPYWEDKLVATHTYNSAAGFTVIDAQGTIKR